MRSPPGALKPERLAVEPDRKPPPMAASILEAIGNTPLVELRQVVARRGLEGRVLAKLEYLNPGSSKKDRVALEIVRRAKLDGRLQPGQVVVEVTSGNTGTGLAIVCGARSPVRGGHVARQHHRAGSPDGRVRGRGRPR